VKVAIIGGTGKMGSAIAKQLSKNHQVILGSRDPARAKSAAEGIEGTTGADYATAARECEVAVIAIPYSGMGAMADLADALAGKLVISAVNPSRFEGGYLHYGLEKGSAAEELASMLSGSRVATAFNNVPVSMMKKAEVVPMDILVAASSKQAYEEAAALVRTVKNLRPLYTGPLSEAQIVERITPLVENLAKWNGTGSLTTRFVSQKG
jgi:8-hydroxy-5-deazaflavin:NADPH oxidoreductase